MKRITVRIHTNMGFLRVEGVAVKVGTISDLFAATPHLMPSICLVTKRWNITHIPSGFCYAASAPSIKEAVEKFEAKIKAIGKDNYEREVRKAMKRSAA